MTRDVLSVSEHPGDLGKAAFHMEFAVILLLKRADVLNKG